MHFKVKTLSKGKLKVYNPRRYMIDDYKIDKYIQIINNYTLYTLRKQIG